MEYTNMDFDDLLEINCFSSKKAERELASSVLEKQYCCEIKCSDMARSVRFAHHARGCTIVAAKLCEGVIIYQNVTIGSNMKYNKISEKWENVGNPILAKNVIVADGAKILGPIVIGENTVVGAGAIITKDLPANSIAFGVNQYKPKNSDYDLVFNSNMISGEEIEIINQELVKSFLKNTLNADI